MKHLLAIFALLGAALGQAVSGPWSVTGPFVANTSASPLRVTTVNPSNGTQGIAYSSQLSAAGGTPCSGPNPYSWSPLTGTLPAGTSLNTSTGLISGTPSASGNSSFSVQVSDCGSDTANSPNFTISISASGGSITQLGENGYCSSTTDSSCFPGGLTDNLAALPATGLYTGIDGNPAPGSTVAFGCPASGAAFVANVASLTAGQTGTFPAGCTVTTVSTITLPVISGTNASNWVYLESAGAANAAFPAEHTLATPCIINHSTEPGYPNFGAAYPSQCGSGDLAFHIVYTGSGDAINFASGANHYRLIGFDIKGQSANNDSAGLLDLAGTDHITLDRSVVHGEPLACSQTAGVYACTSHDTKNGVGLGDSTSAAVIDSWLYDLACPQGSCSDSHAFGGGNGALPSHTFKLYNNFISAAGESWIIGGGGVGATTVTPTDFEVRHNFSYKNPNLALCTGCSGQHPEFKNLGEFKNAQRILVEGNVFRNSWQGWQTDQSGYCFLLTPKNQGPNTNPNAIVTDATVRFNDFGNCVNGIQSAPVPDDDGSKSLGLHNASLHDNLLQGLNFNLNNAAIGNGKATCFQATNGQVGPANLFNYTIEHNTCAIAAAGPFTNSGFDSTLDETNTTTNGADGQYFSNRVIRNNIGPAGGTTTYQNGTIYPGGLLAGLKQQSCTPAVTGTTCTWTYTDNVLGIGQWTNQTNNTPFPSTNQTCGGVTCFPSGSAFTNAFTNYNGPAGQPGYLGNYVLAPGSPYLAAGSDGKDIGISDWTQFNNKTSGVFIPTAYTAAAIVQAATLPDAVSGTAYSQCINSTSASDLQWWNITSGSLPSGLSLGPSGGKWCITGTSSTLGTSTFTLQMMDAAQQYASQSFSLTVVSSAALTWQPLSNPPGFTSIRQIAFDGSNRRYECDRVNGITVSTDQGSTWSTINAGLADTQCWTISYDSTHNLMFATLLPNPPTSPSPSLYESTVPVVSWTQVTLPSNMRSSTSVSNFTGVIQAANGNEIFGVQDGAGNTCGTGFLTDSGSTWSASTCNAVAGGQWASFLNPNDNSIWIGTEQYGAFRSTDNGQTYTEASLPSTPINPGGGTWGNLQGLAVNNSGKMLMGGQGGIWIQSGSGPVWTWTPTLSTGSTVNTRTLFKDPIGKIYWSHSCPKSGSTCITTGPWAATIWVSTDGGNTFAADPQNTGSVPPGLEAWQFIVNPNDGKLYCNVQNGNTNVGSMYVLQ